MTMKRVVYISRSLLTGDFTDVSRQLRELVNVSKANNAQQGITGAILYMDGHFCQAIEGPESSVDRLMTQIQADKRHTDLEILTDEPVSETLFSNWEMANLGLIQDPPEYHLNAILGRSDGSSAKSRRRAVHLIQLMEERLREFP